MKKITSIKVLSLLSAFFFAGTNLSHAAGFQLREQGASLQGLSFAGATAKADDLSTIFYNPAGMTRLSGDKVQFNATYIAPSAKFSLESATSALGGTATYPNASEHTGGDAGEAAIVPAFYMMWDLKPDLKLGLSVNTPYGLSTEYEDGWVGRYYALNSELQTITITPSIAKRLNDKWSVGGGIAIQQASAKLTKAVNFDALIASSPDGKSTLEGDDIGYGFTLGTLYEMNDRTRIGVSYRSQIQNELKGDVKISGVPGPLAANPAFSSTDVGAEITTPDTLSIGAYHKINNKLAVMGDLSFTNWSTFDQLLVTNESDGAVRERVEEKWRNSYFAALGLEYTPDAINTYQVGVAYDQTPVEDQYRTFRIPDSNRTWLSTGYSRKIDDDTSVSLGYSYIRAGKVSLTEDASSLGGAITGHVDAHVHILSANFTKRF